MVWWSTDYVISKEIWNDTSQRYSEYIFELSIHKQREYYLPRNNIGKENPEKSSQQL